MNKRTASHAPPENTAATAAQRAIVVLTSARSGSSVTTHALQVLGVDLGDRLRPGARKNPKGFFEDRDILKLSRRLRDILVAGRRLSLVPEERWDTPATRALEDKAVKLIERRFSTTPLWGFKNGRTLRFLPFWLRVFDQLDMSVDYVFALRNPLASSASRSRARHAKAFDHDTGIEVNQFQWLIEIAPYFALLRDQSFVVVEFERLTRQPESELERLRQQLALPPNAARRAAIKAFTESFLARDLIHHRHDIDSAAMEHALHPAVLDAYRWLHALATDEIATDHPPLWQDWQRIRGELEALAPLLQRLETVDRALRRAQLNPLTPIIMAARQLSRRHD